MQDVAHLLRTRRFLPMFATQFLGAFNDNLFRTAMVLLVIYGSTRTPTQEATFSAIAGGLFILPFFLLVGACRPAGRRPRQGADRPHREDRRNPDHDRRRRRACCLHNIPLLLLALLRDGRPLDLLRPDQIRDPAAASAHGRSARRHRPGRGRNLYRASSAARSSAACWSCSGPTAASMPNGRRSAVLVVALIGRVAGQFVPPAPPARRAPPFQLRLAHRPRLDHAGQRDHAHPAAVPGDPRDQLLLGDRRGADRSIPAAGQECARRRPDSRDACSSPSSRSASRSARSRSTGCCKGEVSARFAPASALLMGAVRARPLLVASRAGRRPWRRAARPRQLPRPSE